MMVYSLRVIFALTKSGLYKNSNLGRMFHVCVIVYLSTACYYSCGRASAGSNIFAKI